MYDRSFPFCHVSQSDNDQQSDYLSKDKGQYELTEVIAEEDKQKGINGYPYSPGSKIGQSAENRPEPWIVM